MAATVGVAKMIRTLIHFSRRVMGSIRNAKELA